MTTDTTRPGIRARGAIGVDAEVARARHAMERFTVQVLALVARGQFRGQVVIDIGPNSVTGKLLLTTGENQDYDFGV